MRYATPAAVVVSFLVATSPPPASATEVLAPPVDAAVERHFDAPEFDYGRGHRGVDYAVAPGTLVRAAAAGTVVFAGNVAGRPAVTIDHGGGMESTYSILSDVMVASGESVDEGRYIGTSGSAHPGSGSGLHFGVKIDDEYVDPALYLGEVDVGDAIHLARLLRDEEGSSVAARGPASESAGSSAQLCRDPGMAAAAARAPNDNVAVAIAGIGSRTQGGTNAAIYERAGGPWALGYPERKVYRFSYGGSRGRRLHERYPPTATYGDIVAAARKLEVLLERIRRRHPHADVDLFAHSQGGLVARAALELVASSFDPRIPRIEHLVTYGTPHRGSPLAEIPERLDHTATGGWIVDRLSESAGAGVGIPDPRSPAVAQMRPDSDFLGKLAREDVLFGTRVLSLAMPHDVIVPVDRALYPGKTGRVMPPSGVNGHKTVVSSPRSRAAVYSFLRDAPVGCPGGWDRWAPVVGAGVTLLQRALPSVYGAFERVALGLSPGGAWAVARRGPDLARALARDALLDTARWLASKPPDGLTAVAGGVDRAVRWGTAAGRLLRSGVARLWPF